MESRYIDISKLPNFEIEADVTVGEKLGRTKFVLLPFEHLSDIPTANVREVVYGYWIVTDTPLGRCCVCSVCGSCPTMTYRFCPYCNAEMISEVREDDQM